MTLYILKWFSECTHCISCLELVNNVGFYCEGICKVDSLSLFVYADGSINYFYFQKLRPRTHIFLETKNPDKIILIHYPLLQSLSKIYN